MMVRGSYLLKLSRNAIKDITSCSQVPALGAGFSILFSTYSLTLFSVTVLSPV